MSTPTDRRPAIRQALLIHGIVQGVGFRPHVARLAADLGLAGDCRNDSTAVIIEIEGEPERVEAFIRRIVDDAPPLARITSVTATATEPRGDTGFAITASTPVLVRGPWCRRTPPPAPHACASCSIPPTAGIVTRSSPAPIAVRV